MFLKRQVLRYIWAGGGGGVFVLGRLSSPVVKCPPDARLITDRSPEVNHRVGVFYQ